MLENFHYRIRITDADGQVRYVAHGMCAAKFDSRPDAEHAAWAYYAATKFPEGDRLDVVQVQEHLVTNIVR